MRVKRFFLLAATLFLSASIFAQNSTISSISINGLRKTKESYIQKILEKFVGQEANENILHKVETVLQAEGLFSEIKASFAEFQDENVQNSEKKSEKDAENQTVGKTLLIEVREKVTFIPLPFASYSNDGLMGGFMLMNMNAFGKKNQFVTGGIFSKKIQMGTVMFSKPAIDIRHPGFTVSGVVSHKDFEIKDFDGDVFFEASSFNSNLGLMLNEKFNSVFSGSIGAKFMMNKLWDREYSFFYDDEEISSSYLWLGSVSLCLKKSNWNGWYLNSSSLSAKTELGISANQDFVREYELKGSLQIPFVPRIRGTLNGAAVASVNKEYPLKLEKISAGSSIVYSNFKTDRIAAASFNLEGALFRKKIATVSVYGFYECAVAEDYDGSSRFVHGPGFGAKAYMQQIAFPAFALGTSYNIPQDKWHFNVAFGISF